MLENNEFECALKVKLTDFNLLERLNSMSDELGISCDDLVAMAVYRLLDDIYVIRKLWIKKEAHLKQSFIYPLKE